MNGLTHHRPVIWLVVLALLMTGCGSVDHKIDLRPGYAVQSDTLVEVGTVSNQTGQTFAEVEFEKILAEELRGKLSEEKLLYAGVKGSKLLVNSKIVEYEPGNAFKRWLLPGWGSTVLTVQCDLKDGDNLVGNINARRTISVGGLYSVGAWRTIFGKLADDIVDELQGKLRPEKK